jgi:RNA polymerase sigma-70 factor, ECF subfamily
MSHLGQSARPVRLEAATAALSSDAQLVERVLAGETAAFEFLVRRYQESLYRVAAGMVLDADVAADLVQDALIRAYSRLRDCRDPERFRFWLFRTLRNRCLDHLKERRQRDVPLDSVSSLGEDPHTLDRIAERTALLESLERLSPALREAFVLRHVEELSYEEMAEVLDAGVSALKMRVMRARETLRETLEAPHVTDRQARSS